MGKQFYRCQNPDCPHQSFLLNLAYKVRLPDIKEQIIDRARGGSSIRDTARVLGMSTRAVLSKLKKRVVIEPCEPASSTLVASRGGGGCHSTC
jgi:transposase-like protein